MTLNRAIIVLEIVAYFMVTVDLYGEERLVRTRDRLRGFFNRLVKTRLLYTLPVRIFLFVIALALLLFSLVFVAGSPFVADIFRATSAPLLVVGEIVALALLGVVALISTLVFDVAVLLLELFEKLLDGLLTLSINMLTKWGFKDILLWTGTILFLASRAMALL